MIFDVLINFFDGTVDWIILHHYYEFKKTNSEGPLALQYSCVFLGQFWLGHPVEISVNIVEEISVNEGTKKC
jgi:hypothetical protein